MGQILKTLFITAWTYNSADQPLTMTYPDGEVLTYATLSDGNLNSMRNASNFYYLSSSKYDEAGRTKELKLGNNLLTKTFSHYPWTRPYVGGQLYMLTVANSAPQNLQKLVYHYDTRGNITGIDDMLAGEYSAFAYDTLNRVEAMTTTNQLFYITHSEAFEYNPDNGTLSGKGVDADHLLPYDYDNTSHPHAVTGFNGNSYEYDANGNQVTRVIGETTYTLIYDGENRLVRVTADLPLERGMGEEPTVLSTPERSDLGETATPTETTTLQPTPTETPTMEPTPTETPTLEPTPTETPTPGPTMQSTPEPGDLGETPTLEPTSTQQSTPDQDETPTIQPTLEPTRTVQSTPERSDEGETPEPTPTETPTETPTDNPLPEDFENPEGESMLLDWEGGEIIYTYDGDGNLVKSIIDNKTTYYPSQYYEKRMVDAQQTIFKYYFVGSVRIALRENGTLTWLLSDHLGSTSGTVNAAGALVSTLKYSAFGETRGAASSSTDYRYTGQRLEEEIGLYFYKARFYDPYLNHFIQPDSIIPDPSNPQSWNRYTYVNNNPIRYTDPSGNYIFEEEPDDPFFAPAHSEINPATRYISAGVSESQAKLIFVDKMSDPGQNIATKYGFGSSNTLDGDGFHPGVDFYSVLNVALGSNILSVLSGKVVEVTKNRDMDFGLHVVIEHNIYGIKLFSVYAHLDQTSVIEGKVVQMGDIVGGMGNTPFPDGDVHLHFEVRTTNNVIIDNFGNYLTLARYSESYWADSYQELQLKWVDLGPRYGYSWEYPW